MTIYERSQLSAEEIDAIQRKQFLPLLRADDQVFEEHYERIDAMDYEARTQVAVEIPDGGNESMPVRWIDLADMMRDMSDKLPSWSTVSLGPSTTNNPHICNAYVRLICNHVNAKRGEQWEALRLKKLKKKQKFVKSRGSAKPGRGSPRRIGSPAREGSPKPSVHQDREPLRGSSLKLHGDINIPLSCKMITAQKYNTINSIGDNEIDEDALDQVLNDIDLYGGNFFELDYLFIPVDNGSHHMLVGVAPKQKFVFAIDSIGTSEKGRNRPVYIPMRFNSWPMIGIMAIMRRCVPEVTFAKYNRILVPNSSFWPIFGQWSSRANKTLDQSPFAPQQSDSYNCGAFTITNAFCLAFGYDLDIYFQDDLVEKKYRVVLELLQKGFFGDFEYDMLELPTNKVVVQPGVPISDSDPLSEYEPSGPIKSGTGSHSDAEMQEVAPDDDNDGGDESFHIKDQGTDHVYLQRPQDAEGYETDQGSEGSDGEADSDWTAATAESRQFYTASEALLNEPSRVDPPPPGSHRPEYPAQLSREFEVAGFMYDIPEVNFQPGLNYSKAELKRACAEFPLVGWKRWSKRRKPLFLSWMLNEMGATMSLIHGDPVKPMDGLGRGYSKWKAQRESTATAT